MTSGTKVHTFEEVAKHDKKGDCWLIISGKVYDLSSFMDDHPGGDDVILTATGKDATNDFEDVGHSDDARDMMKKYYVGEIDSSSIPAEVQKPTPTPTPTAGGAAAGSSTVNQTSENIIKILQFLLPLLILGLAYAYREYTKKE